MTTLPEIVHTLHELKNHVRCRCSPHHTSRGIHNTDCADYLVDKIDEIIEYVTEGKS